MSKYLFQISTAVLIASQTFALHAQVFNSPAAPPVASQQTTGVQPAGGPMAAPAGPVEQTGWGIPMPKITLPKITMPKVSMPSMTAVTAPFKAGFSKVSAGSKKAMEGAKEMLSFGRNKQDNSTANQANGQQHPSFWQRLIVREQEQQVPQTVGEFMSQPRLDP